MTNATVHHLRAGSRRLRANSVLDQYWRFAVERQRVFWRRASGRTTNLTSDPIIAVYRFTNPYRAADRVSQYVVALMESGEPEPLEVVFRVLAFKFFNRISTWDYLKMTVRDVTWQSFDRERWAAALDDLARSGQPIYNNAYVMPPPKMGERSKHRNHLALLEHMMRTDVAHKVRRASSLADVYGILRGYPAIGQFLGFQYAIDLNYSEIIDFSEMDFVVAGPGARRGITKCFADTDGLSFEDVIRVVTDLQEEELERCGLRFAALPGRALQLIDCQNLFCEIDKYTRACPPLAAIGSGRRRIKQRYRPSNEPVHLLFPSKWKISKTALRVTIAAESEA